MPLRPVAPLLTPELPPGDADVAGDGGERVGGAVELLAVAPCGPGA